MRARARWVLPVFGLVLMLLAAPGCRPGTDPVRPALGLTSPATAPSSVADRTIPAPPWLAPARPVTASPASTPAPAAKPLTAVPVDYRALDRYALAAPSTPSSLRSLAACFRKRAKSDRDKARLIYRWLAANINYDTDAFFSGSELPVRRLTDVLRTHRAVCAGYSGLFTALAKELGLQAVTVVGFGRGYGYQIGEPYTRPNHAWNAVKIDGAWQLVDATWGAGCVDDSHRYRRSFRGCYFLTPPSIFVYTHFPEDPRWQLLAHPYTRREHEKLPFFDVAGLCQGIVVKSPRTQDLAVKGPFRCVLQAPPGTVCYGQLWHDGHVLPNDYTLSQWEDGRLVIHAVCPRPGTYEFRVGCPTPGENSMTGVARYRVTARAASPADGFPETYRDFYSRRCRLLEPWSGTLTVGRPRRFSVQIPGADKVAVVQGQRWQPLRREGDAWNGFAGLRPGDVQVCTHSAADAPNRWTSVLGYRAR